MPKGIYKRKPLSEEHRRKISESSKGKKKSPRSEEHKRKLSEAHKGQIPWIKGKKMPPRSEETRRKISEANRGRKLSEETKRKISEAKKGEKNPNWQDGKSFEPYSIDWTQTLKRSIRERDKYICQICGKEPAIDVHHIDYDKKNCNPDNLVTLCKDCHNKTGRNRDYWIDFFKKYGR